MKVKSAILLYDERCYHCVNFAKAADFLARGKIRFVGHYSSERRKIDNSAKFGFDMFWLIKGRTAYGGRAALFPLLREVLRPDGEKIKNRIEYRARKCKNDCSLPYRVRSLFSKSRKIEF